MHGTLWIINRTTGEIVTLSNADAARFLRAVAARSPEAASAIEAAIVESVDGSRRAKITSSPFAVAVEAYVAIMDTPTVEARS